MKKNVNGFKSEGTQGFSRSMVWNGTDPEAELFTERGTLVSATSVGLRCGADQEIGADGAGTPAELRPKPGKPETVIKNIRNIFKRFARRFPGYTLSTEGSHTSIGAHIHVSIKDRRISDTQAMAISQVVDDFLGRVVINTLAGQARTYSGYNRLTAYRMQTYNNTTTGFEYRSCPAGIMLNPELFRLCLKIVRMVTWTMFNKKRFSYEAPTPTARDYQKVCHFPLAEYEAFQRLIGEYAGADKNILRSWGVAIRPATARPVAERRQQFRVAFSFNDDWNADVRALLVQGLDALRTHERSFSIHLFGLRADRGNVMAGLTVSGFTSIAHSNAGFRNGALNIGVAHSFRTGADADGVRIFLESLRQVISYYDRPGY